MYWSKNRVLVMVWVSETEKPHMYKIVNIGLQFLASGLSNYEIRMKSTQNLIKANVSTKTIQFDECRRGAMTLDFMKSRIIAPSMHPPNWRVFVETSDFIRFWVDFTWNLLDFRWNLPDFMKSGRFHECELLRDDQV